MLWSKRILSLFCVTSLVMGIAYTNAAFGAASLMAKRAIASPYYTAGTSTGKITVTVTPPDGKTSSAITVETFPEGFTPAEITVSNGTTAVSGTTLTWTLNNASAASVLTYVLTAPATDVPLFGTVTGTVTEGTVSIDLGSTIVKHEPGLGPKWVIGSSSGIWAVMDGVLRAYADTSHDPKHIWVNLDLPNGNYSVVCDCKMANWEDEDHSRAGIAIRINPDDNGKNAGSDRGICLLFHNDTNSIDMLNDLTAWGESVDIGWEVGQWYTMGLTGYDDTTIDAFFIEQGEADGLSDQAYLTTWFNDDLAARSPGFPGLTASSYTGLEVQFDNFKVLDEKGNVVFEDNFDEANTIPLSASLTVNNAYYNDGGTVSGITINVSPAAGISTNAVITETIPEGFTASNIQATNGTASVSNGTLTWTLSEATSPVQLTFDLTVPKTDFPLYGILKGTAQVGSWDLAIDPVTLKHTTGLGPKWVIGSGGGAWVVSEGVLRASADSENDPKHAWVNLDMADGDYTVVCDCRMANWVDGDHPRAGVAIRINPDDNGANPGSDRGINLLFHNDTNSVDLLNDNTSWGTLTDVPWEVGKWYTFALTGNGSNVDGYFLEQGVADALSDEAYLSSWDDTRNADRSPGFPGLTASTAADLEVQFDNFKVLDKNGNVLFEDNFNEVSAVSEWSIY